MRHWNHQIDVSNALPTDFLLGHFNTTAVTYDAAVTDAFVLATETLVILDRSEDLLTKETVPLGLVRPVVDRLWLEYFSAGLFQNVLGGSQADDDGFES